MNTPRTTGVGTSNIDSYTIYLLCVGTLLQQLQVCVFPADKTSQNVTIIIHTYIFGVHRRLIQIYNIICPRRPPIYIYIHLRWVLGTLFVTVFADNYFLIHRMNIAPADGRFIFIWQLVPCPSIH